MKIVAVSDAHGTYDWLEMPAGDILICAGDMTNVGSTQDVRDFRNWLADQPYPEKVFIAGNHDWLFEKQSEDSIHQMFEGLPGVIYLHDSAYICKAGYSIYGTPYQPIFCNWAFNRPEAELEKIYQKIPKDIDILLTHTPPLGTLDKTDGAGLKRVGSSALVTRVTEVKPKVHIFGHIHQSSGRVEKDGILFVNASVLDDYYRPYRQPQVIEI